MQRVAGEEGCAGGAMADMNWSRRYGFPGRLIVNVGHGHGQELTRSPLGKISAFGVGLEVRLMAAGL